MNIPKSDLKIETMRGSGPGGQHRNKTESAVRLTHIPTGIQAYADERSQHHSRKAAMQELERRLEAVADDRIASAKKALRDYRIANEVRIRTYYPDKNEVIDHRSKKRARFTEVVKKGRIDLLWDE